MLLETVTLFETENKGRGMITTQALKKDTIVEIAPVIVMSEADKEHLNKTLLHDYIFTWGDDGKKCCLALGYISIYNHNYNSNCEYYMNYDEETIFIKTIRNIKANEELTINYNGDSDNKDVVWFDVKE